MTIQPPTMTAEEIALLVGRDAAETEAELTSGPLAQPYRIGRDGRRIFDAELACYALGITPAHWQGLLCDAAIREVSGTTLSKRYGRLA